MGGVYLLNNQTKLMRKLYSFLTTVSVFMLFAGIRVSAQCSENFDGVTAPNLPSGWTATTNVTCAGTTAWVTTSGLFDSAPNSATTNDPACISDEWLTSLVFPINSPSAQLTFKRNNNLENTFDGMVLEISINGGAYQDIITAGGSFVTGGYNGVISVNFGSPIAGRNAWTGNSGGWVTTTVNLPAAANGQPVRLRWRRASDSSVSGTGANIDGITITGCAFATPCSENFNSVAVPALPTGWTATPGVTCANTARWATVNTSFNSAPNSAFANDPNCISDEYLDSKSYAIISAAAQLTFMRNNNLENGFDGMVLEISIGGGPFTDIITAGGSFVTGGYNGTISVNFGSPIAGRQAWTGNSGGWVTTTVNLPAAANGQNIILRWRRASDSSVSATGVNIDDIVINGSDCTLAPCAGVPSPGSINGPAGIICGGTPVNLSLTGYTNAGGISFQWKSSTVSGGPYTAIAGATSSTYSFNASASAYYIVTVTCANGGGAANTVEFQVRVSNIAHSNLLATPSTVCSPGSTVITGTASGSLSPGNYTHTLTGPGVIVPNPPSGTQNANFSFSVSGIPAGNQVYTVTSTDAGGCSKQSTVNVTVNATPSVTLSTTPAPASAPCTENFDGVTVPALPAQWTASTGATCAGSLKWATVNTTFDSPPNSVFTNDVGCISDEYLVSRPYTITTAGQITFRRNNILENGFDGMVLEISINGGAFTDIITAGGSFVTGGYNGTISVNFGSPILGRQAWTGNSGGWVTTTVNLPASANGQSVVFRFRRATDSSVGSTGVNIDGVIVNNTSSCSVLTVCNSSIVRIDATTSPGFPQTFTQPFNTIVPAAPNTSGIASPYPNTLAISGLPATGVTVKSVTLGTYSHSFPDDVDVVLVSPTGQAVILMSDVGGSTAANGQTFVLDDAAAVSLADNAFNPSGTYKPTNIGAGDTWPLPGPAGPFTTTLSSFTGNMNGNWNLYVVDDAAGATGIISTFSITFNVPPPVVFSPTTELYSNSAATIAYTGQPTYTVWSKQTASRTYTATASQNGCSGIATITINIDQPPSITSQPSTTTTMPACPGYNIVYTVGAAGAGLTYKWQVSTNGGGTFSDIQVNPNYSGFTTNQLTVINPQPNMTGYQFRVIVSGTCTPSPVTSNAVTMTIAQVPTITSVTTNPSNASVCVGQNITFTAAFSGSPTPNIFQWQSSPDGVNWTNLTTGGSFTPVFTITGATLAQNGLRYRVIVTNLCGQSATSTPVTLTVSTNVPTVTALPNRICISDSLIPLQGLPVGGSWSGIGVSGFNFVPSATALGTYTLTYTYTNPSGCTASATVTAKVEDCPERIRLLRDDAVVLFPNPNNGRFNFKMNSTLYNYINMRVYNSQGQLVNNRYFGNLVYGRVVPVDLHMLPVGVYFVKFGYDDGIRTSEKTFTVVIGR